LLDESCIVIASVPTTFGGAYLKRIEESSVIPAQAGIHLKPRTDALSKIDSRLRGNDKFFGSASEAISSHFGRSLIASLAFAMTGFKLNKLCLK
jgi:hypothetical protein